MRGGGVGWGESPPSFPASLFPPFFPSFYLSIPVCLNPSPFPSLLPFGCFLPSRVLTFLSNTPLNFFYFAFPNLHILQIFSVRESIWNSWNSYAEHNQCLIHRSACLSRMRDDTFVLLIASLRHVL